MNARERFLAIAKFKRPDMVPVGGEPRKATLDRWYREGLPKNVDPSSYFKFEPGADMSFLPSEGFEFRWNRYGSHGVNLGPIPPFDFRIIEKNDRYWVWIDGLGIKQRGFKDDWEDGWSGFATRQFMEFPVKDRSSFLEMKRRYDLRISERYPKYWSKMVKEWELRKYPLCVTLRGPFWWTRDMMGLENMLITMHRDQGLISDIMDFCVEFQISVLEKALNEINVDWAMLNEDMAYKKGPMISPQAMRDFMLRPYKTICNNFKEHGIDVIIIDSDGNTRPLIPIWLETGINGVTPCEIASGMDPVELRKEYPSLILMGGIDKRDLARDEQAIKREVLSKVPYLIKSGGYFPAVDHGIPPDISLKNYKYFLNFTRMLCGWPETYMIS